MDADGSEGNEHKVGSKIHSITIWFPQTRFGMLDWISSGDPILKPFSTPMDKLRN